MTGGVCLCNKIRGRIFLLWHWCQRGRKESSSKCFGNRVELDWSNAEESMNVRMQRRVESECNCFHQCQRGRLLENSVNRQGISVYLSLMASTVVVVVMKKAMNSSATIIGRRRVNDRWFTRLGGAQEELRGEQIWAVGSKKKIRQSSDLWESCRG